MVPLPRRPLGQDADLDRRRRWLKYRRRRRGRRPAGNLIEIGRCDGPQHTLPRAKHGTAGGRADLLNPRRSRCSRDLRLPGSRTGCLTRTAGLYRCRDVSRFDVGEAGIDIRDELIQTLLNFPHRVVDGFDIAGDGAQLALELGKALVGAGLRRGWPGSRDGRRRLPPGEPAPRVPSGPHWAACRLCKPGG